MYNISLESLFEAYWDCRRNKSRTRSASEFEVHYERNLIELRNEIYNGLYTQRPSSTFIVTKPDYREIFAADFRDRIVHHWVRQRLEPLMEQELIPTTFNCRKGKGTLAAQQYMYNAIKEETSNYRCDCYIMKIDIKGFFTSIDRLLICDKVLQFATDRYHDEDKDALLFLIRKVLLNAPEQHCIRKGDVRLWKHIPLHKSLFTNNGKGLPIGDLIVQMAANLLLNDTDHFITDDLGITMARYVDDMVLISRSKKKLLGAVPQIRCRLKQTAGVILHPKKFYLQHYSKGVKFIGAVIKKGRTYVSNRTVNNAFSCVRQYNKLSEDDRAEYAEKLVASLNSYLGIMRHHATFNIRRRLIQNIDKEWWKYIYAAKDYSKVTLRNRFTNKYKTIKH